MVAVTPGRGRAEVANVGADLVVTIPTKRNFLIVGFLSVWLIGWCFGEVTVIQELQDGRSDDRLFMIVWLTGWTVGGAFAFYAWLWNLSRKEVISLDAVTLKHQKKALFFSRSKEYEIQHVSNMRSVPALGGNWLNPSRGMEIWGISGGSIAFDYGRSTHHFGIALDEADARYVVEQLSKHNGRLTR